MALNANTVLVSSSVRGGKAVLRFNGTSTNVVVISNSSSNSDIGNPTNEVTLTGATITGLWWCVNSSITVARGGNLVANLVGFGTLSSQQGWPGDKQTPSANIVVTFNTAGGTLYMEIHKQYETGDD